jgi:hypothetical protein
VLGAGPMVKMVTGRPVVEAESVTACIVVRWGACSTLLGCVIQVRVRACVPVSILNGCGESWRPLAVIRTARRGGERLYDL